MRNNKVYFTIHNPELYSILKDVMKHNWQLGKDLAVLSHNDDAVREIIFGRITTFSTDFGKMGEIATHTQLIDKKFRKLFQQNYS